MQDGTGTDAQNLASATLSGTTLTVAIENGASVNVDLSSLLTDIETRLDAIEACACSGTLATTTVSGEREMGARLYQNTPNPYSIETKLSFFIPIKYSVAYLKISDMNGRVLQKINIEQRGEGFIMYDRDYLASGMYFYSLYVEGVKVASKKMIVN